MSSSRNRGTRPARGKGKRGRGGHKNTFDRRKESSYEDGRPASAVDHIEVAQEDQPDSDEGADSIVSLVCSILTYTPRGRRTHLDRCTSRHVGQSIDILVDLNSNLHRILGTAIPKDVAARNWNDLASLRVCVWANDSVASC